MLSKHQSEDCLEGGPKSSQVMKQGIRYITWSKFSELPSEYVHHYIPNKTSEIVFNGPSVFQNL
jgi:hypothetical protein